MSPSSPAATRAAVRRAAETRRAARAARRGAQRHRRRRKGIAQHRAAPHFSPIPPNNKPTNQPTCPNANARRASVQVHPTARDALGVELHALALQLLAALADLGRRPDADALTRALLAHAQLARLFLRLALRRALRLPLRLALRVCMSSKNKKSTRRKQHDH